MQPIHRVMSSFIATAVLLVAGCQDISTSVTYSDETNFSPLKTYRWLPPELQGTANRDIGGVAVEQVIQDDVDRTFAARGFRLAPEGTTPDFYIRATSILQFDQVRQPAANTIADPGVNRRNMQTPSPGPYGSTGGGSFEQWWATLILTMTEPKSDKQLWRGSAETTIPWNASADARADRVERAVQKLLAQFPPKGR